MKRASLLLVAGWLMVRAAAAILRSRNGFSRSLPARFPVEAARVWHGIATWTARESRTWIFAWRNLPEHESVWSIEWRDANRRVLRKATVKYREEALLTGRRGIAYVAATDGKTGCAKQPRGRSCGRFWRGVKAQAYRESRV